MLTNTLSTAPSTRKKNGTLPGWSRAGDPIEDIFNSFLRRPSDGTRIVENEDSYDWMIEMPGVGKDNIDVTVEDGTLRVETNYEDEGENHYARRNISKAVRIGKLIDTDEISATYENGVLNVNMPKVDEETTTGRKIEVT